MVQFSNDYLIDSVFFINHDQQV